MNGRRRRANTKTSIRSSSTAATNTRSCSINCSRIISTERIGPIGPIHDSPMEFSEDFVRRSFLASILLACALAVSQPSNYAQVKRETAKPSVAAQDKQVKTKPAAIPAPQEKRETAKTAAAPERFGNVEAIMAAQLKEWLYVVASDEMEGRDTPSRGLDMTAKFIADHLSQWGVKPGGDDGTYFQKFALTSRRVEPEMTIDSVNGQSFKRGEVFIAEPIQGQASGRIVYVG